MSKMSYLQQRECKHTTTALGPARGFHGCVAPHDCDPVAHGNVAYCQRCSDCKAYRYVNSNAGHSEAGPWIEDDCTIN